MTDTSTKVKIDDCWNQIGVWGDTTNRCPRLEEVIHCRNCDIYSAAGKIVLERRLPEQYQDQWAKVYSESKDENISGTESITIFRLGDEWMALPTNIIEEITDISTIHSLPHKKSKIVRGLMNLRGQMSICVSLGHLMDIGKTEKIKSTDSRNRTYERMIAIKHNGSSFVFLVSEVRSTYRYRPDELKEAPSTLKGAFTRGIISWKGHEISCLDTELLFYTLRNKLA